MPLKKSDREGAAENTLGIHSSNFPHFSVQDRTARESDRKKRGLETSFLLLRLPLTEVSLGRHYIAMFEATQNVMLKPTESWRESLLDHRVMDLFFTVSINLYIYSV